MKRHPLDSILETVPVGVMDNEGNLLSMALVLTYEIKEAMYKRMENPLEWDSIRNDDRMKCKTSLYPAFPVELPQEQFSVVPAGLGEFLERGDLTLKR